VRLAERGIGIMPLSKEFPNIDKRNLVPVLPDVRGPIIDLYYVYPKAIKNSKRVIIFGEFLQSCIPEDHKIRERMVHKEASMGNSPDIKHALDAIATKENRI
jgi:hypothetical protein